ncbi:MULTISPECIES: DUF5565 family protein [Nocardia]|uniref:RNA ligase 1 family protein n=1 Tax=Nocardia TaxID=1817 RepID=UPI00245400CC|nr:MULTISPECIES: DUF5565 family protein [Nocardia]
MKKIPSLYLRDPNDMAYVTREVNPLCRWVIENSTNCIATVKHDGTCVMLDSDGRWWARHQVRPDKIAPANFVPVETDPVTGKTQGWIPMEQSQYRKFHAEAATRHDDAPYFRAGTYELIGPRIGRNPHGTEMHSLLPHGCTPLAYVPTGYDDLAEYLRGQQETWRYLEGIVWHSDDGRMAKIKLRDFPKVAP